MGRIRAQLFRDIADDAADRLAHLDTLSSTDNTARFDGVGALENLRGQVKLFELLMRRAAAQCEAIGLQGDAQQSPNAFVRVSLEIILSNRGLVHPDGEEPSLKADAPIYIRRAYCSVDPSIDDTVSARDEAAISVLIDRIESQALLSCSPVKPPKPAKGKTNSQPLANASGVKRGRGRPRKDPLMEAVTAPKRRGRPPKPETPVKRGRGRPRKYP